MAFYPVHSCNLQAMNAVGRSDLFLKLEIIKKSYGLVALMIAVVFFETPLAIAMTGIFTTVISCFVNSYPNKKLINYSYFEQMRDILPSFLLSVAMFVAVYAVGFVPISTALILVLQIFVGVLFYVVMSVIMRISPFYTILSMLKKLKKN